MRWFKRSDWEARPARSRSTVAPKDRKELVVHYAEMQEAGREDCAAMVRAIQNFHMDAPDHKWADIGYNLLVCKHGDVFEGRGWDVIGAHSPNHNTIGIGVCFLGNDDPNVQDAPEAALAAIRWCAEEADRHCGHALERKGHKDTQRPGYTSCPGTELWNWIHAGMPLQGEPAPQPVPVPGPGVSAPVPPQPTPQPVPQPTPAPEPDWTSELVANLPTLKNGAKGQPVRNLQGLLVANGNNIAVDGAFGPKSEAAVKSFQKKATLSADGIVGPKTWRALLGA